MSSPRSAPGQSPRRAPGTKAGITRDQIVAAARTLDPADLTMQAVATLLGVDRKAVHHHVTDRRRLLELAAAAAFAETFAAELPEDSADWEHACRSYARGFTRSLLSMGPLADSFHPSSDAMRTLLQPADRILRIMTAAGFSDEATARTLHLLSSVCVSHARNALHASPEGEHPGVNDMRALLAEPGRGRLPDLRRVVAGPVRLADEEQLRFAIDVVLRGAAGLLPAPGTPSAR